MNVFANFRQDKGCTRSWFGLNQPFDREYRLVTSSYFQPYTLLGVRVSFATYCIVTCIITGVNGVQTGEEPWWYLVAFTHLSFIGLTSYFCIASLHTLFFLLSLWRLERQEVDEAAWYPLQKWGRVLQGLHLWLFATAATFPFLTTIVWWGLLRDKSAFATRFSAWSNVSVHTLNSVLIMIEILISRMRLYWGYLPLSLITLGLYLSLAYLAQYLHGQYRYGFLDPVTTGRGKVAVFLGGMLVGYCALFAIMWVVMKLRDWCFPCRKGVRAVG